MLRNFKRNTRFAFFMSFFDAVLFWQFFTFCFCALCLTKFFPKVFFFHAFFDKNNKLKDSLFNKILIFGIYIPLKNSIFPKDQLFFLILGKWNSRILISYFPLILISLTYAPIQYRLYYRLLFFAFLLLFCLNFEVDDAKKKAWGCNLSLVTSSIG